MNKQKLSTLIVLLLGVLFVVVFTSIAIYVIIASLISAIGIPLKNAIQRISIKQRNLSDSVSALFSIAIIFGFIIGILLLLGPIVISQSKEISTINFQSLSEEIQQPLARLETKLVELTIIKPEDNLENIVVDRIENIVKSIQVNTILNHAINFTGSLLIGIFSILFISFFFIKDDKLFTEIILFFIPTNERLRVKLILLKVREILSKYFLGLLIDVFLVMTIISIGCFIVGVKNAILIGVICGLLNLIPYLGPIIGALVASTLVLVSSINLGFDTASTFILKTLLILMIANLIDSFVFQPIIYSNSVKAHPLEIFIVILMGGIAVGPIGMILAVPTYTILRIVAKEFLGEYEFIQKLTRNI